MFSEVSPDVQVTGNLVLLELLVTNLLNNAVRHNHSGGEIYVRLMQNKLEVKNTGEALKVDANDIFNRFKKGSDNPDSLGLGLSIVKRICTEHQFDIKYTRADEQHCFTVSW